MLAAIAAIALSASACIKDGPESDANVKYTLTQAKSPKRGVGYNNPVLPDQDLPLIGPALSWAYNWSNTSPADDVDAAFTQYGVSFIPMIWNGSWNKDNIRKIKQLHPEAQYLLAFNEPNLTDQANMTPQQAAASVFHLC